LTHLLAVLLALQSPRARAAPPAEVLEALAGARHQCQDAMSGLDARAADDAVAAVERADCLYRLGRLGSAAEALASLLGPAGGGDALSPHDRGEALALHAILLARTDRPADAESARLRMPSEDSARDHRVRAVLAATHGRLPAAWSLVDEALERWPRDPHAVRAAAEVAVLDPDRVTPAARAAIRRPVEVVRQHNLAVSALGAGDGPRCLTHVEQGLAAATDPEAPRLQELGYVCAVAAGRPDSASRLMLARRSVAALPAASVARHAELLLSAGRSREASRLLGVLRTEDPSLRRDVDSLRIRAFVQEGDLDGAVAVARPGAGHPGTRANLARTLGEAGRVSEAMALLDGACGELEGRAARDCQGLRDWLSR